MFPLYNIRFLYMYTYVHIRCMCYLFSLYARSLVHLHPHMHVCCAFFCMNICFPYAYYFWFPLHMTDMLQYAVSLFHLCTMSWCSYIWWVVLHLYSFTPDTHCVYVCLLFFLLCFCFFFIFLHMHDYAYSLRMHVFRSCITVLYHQCNQVFLLHVIGVCYRCRQNDVCHHFFFFCGLCFCIHASFFVYVGGCCFVVDKLIMFLYVCGCLVPCVRYPFFFRHACVYDVLTLSCGELFCFAYIWCCCVACAMNTY